MTGEYELVKSIRQALRQGIPNEISQKPVEAADSLIGRTGESSRTREKRVFIKHAEKQTRTLLVRFCIQHFSEFVKGSKNKFWDDI